MKKEISYLIIGASVFGAIIGFSVYFSAFHEGFRTDDTFSKVPGRLTEIGPYAKNINLTENIGAYALNISAEQLYVKKGKFMGFDTALQKKFITNKFHLTLYKNGTKMIELSKDRLVLDSFMKTIEINDPQIQYPDTMKKVKKIKLEKDRKLLTIHYHNKTDVWNLAD
jgi:hypothetical protein